MRRRIATVALAATIATSGLVLPATPAQAGECVSRTEYRRVNRGMSKTRVHRIFGFDGRQTMSYRLFGNLYTDRQYKTCTRFGFASVSYKNGNVKSKFVIW